MEKRHELPVDLESQGNSKFVTSSKQRVSPCRAHSSVGLCETLNDKQNRECNLRDKLNKQNTEALGKIVVLVGSVACMTRPVSREPILRYHMQFSRGIEEMDSPKKFTPLRFTLYDGKSDLRSHISPISQMMSLWNHLEALMCRVFPSSLGDFELKWFD